jgi:SAM-dependent methyltransferase
VVTFETIGCPACGSANYRHAFEVRDRFNIIPDRTYSIVRCQSCQLLFVNPRPDALSIAAFYQIEGYDPFVGGKSGKSWTTAAYKLARRFTVPRKVARAMNGLQNARSALDIGCATGEFAAALGKHGLQVCGVEPDPGAAEHARATFGLTVWTGNISAVPHDAGPFDVITMWHVLEHVHDLKGTLARVRELLSPEGRFVIAVPNPLSFDARQYGRNWVAWEAPRHLYHFEPDVLLSLLDREGFAARRAGALAFDAFYHSLLSESASMFGKARAGWRGTLSFLRGAFGGEGSSELYLAKRRNS